MTKVNVDIIGVFVSNTINPQHKFKAKDSFNISKIYPDAVKAIAITNGGSEVLRHPIPIDKDIEFHRSGGGAAITGGRYNAISWNKNG